MSHFSSITSKLTNKELLKVALQQQPEVKEVKEKWYVRGYQGQTVKSDVVGILKGNYDIGFVLQNDSSYAIADWGCSTCPNGNSSGSQNLTILWQRIVATYNTLYTLDQSNKNKGLQKANINVVVH